MKLLPDEIRAQIPPLYSQEKSKDPTVYVKFFAPWGNYTFYVTEAGEEGDDLILFGYTILFEKEWGYSSLKEIESTTGPMGLKIERDLYFKPCKFSELKDRGERL